MANKILIKKSSTQGAVPTTSQIDLAELAINTFDGRLFAKKNDGSASIVDLKQNDPIRILGDASSTYSASSVSGEYYSNVTMTLNNVNSNSGTYGGKTGSGLSQVIRIPQIVVNTKGLVTDSANVSFTLSDLGFGTMAQQNANAVTITGGTIDGTTIGGTTAAAGTFTSLASDSLDVTNNATVGGDLSVDGDFTIQGLTAGHVTFAGASGQLTDSGDLTFDSASGNLTAKGGVISTDLHVGGDTYISGSLTVRGTTTTVNSTTVSVGDLNIELASSATNAAQADGGGITVHGPTTAATITYASVDDSWNFNKKVNLSDDLAVTGDVSATNITASGDVSATNITASGDVGSATVTTTGDVTVGGALDVTGATTLTTLSTSGAATLNSLTVTNNATVTGDLGVNGTLTFTTATGGGLQVKAIGNVTPGTAAFTTLTASGATTFTATTQSTDKDTGAVVVEGGVGIEKNLNVGGDFGLVGNASVNGISVSQNASVGGKLDVTGATSLSTLSTSGAATLNSASVTNNATVGGTLGVTGATTLSNNLTVGGTLGVTGATTLTTVTTGNATINGASITQNATVGGTLDVTGDTTIAGTLNANNGIAVDTNKFTVANGTGNTYIDGTLQVHGAATFDDGATFTGLVTADGLKSTDLTATRIVFVGTAGRLVDSANLTWDGSKFYVNGKGEFSGNVTMTGIQTYTAGDYTTGALTVAGDVSMAKALQVKDGIYTNGNQVLDTTSTIDGGSY